MKAPMLIPLLAMIAGILSISLGANIILGGIAILIAGIIWLILIGKSKNPVIGFRINQYHWIWIFLMFFGLGNLDATLSKPFKEEKIDKYIAFKGHVREVENKTSGDIIKVDIKQLIDSTGSISYPQNLTILVHSNGPIIDVDDLIMVSSHLSLIREPEENFDSSYTEFLNHHGIYYECYSDLGNLKITGKDTSIIGISTNFRNNLISIIENTNLRKDLQRFLITIFLGDRSYLNPELRNLLSDGGLSHILALSGMHIAIIAVILMWLLFPMNFIGMYKLRMLLTAILLIGYCFITGMAPSTMRATLMLLSTTVAIILERKQGAWGALTLSTFIIVLFSPYSIYDVGLQLSFTCVASLIFFVNPLNPIGHHDHPILYKSVSIVLCTIVATLATWSLTAHYFGRIPTTFLALNLIVVPLLPYYLILALCYLVLTELGLDFELLQLILENIFDGFKSYATIITNAGSSSIYFTPGIYTTCLWILFLIVIALALHSRRYKWHKYSILLTSILILTSIAIDINTQPLDEALISKDYYHIKVKTKLKSGVYETILTKGTISEHEALGNKIISVDRPLPVRPNNNHTEKVKCSILILCSGYKDNLQSLISYYQPETIVLHRSIHKKKEQELINEADSLNIKLYSIRNDGVYRFK